MYTFKLSYLTSVVWAPSSKTCSPIQPSPQLSKRDGERERELKFKKSAVSDIAMEQKKVCRYSAMKEKKVLEFDHKHTHLASYYFLVLITQGDPHILVHSPVHVSWDA